MFFAFLSRTSLFDIVLQFALVELESLIFQALVDVPLNVREYNPVYKESLTEARIRLS